MYNILHIRTTYIICVICFNGVYALHILYCALYSICVVFNVVLLYCIMYVYYVLCILHISEI